MSLTEKQKQILNLLADGQFHSGTELADALGISRSAICKHINTMTLIGLSFAAVTGRGYRLNTPLQWLDDQVIYNLIEPTLQTLVAPIEIYPQIDSTNRYLLEQPTPPINTAQVCLAESQTAGKGRRGRHWVSPFGSNLYLSLKWQFNQGYASAAGLSLAIGLAVIKALQHHHVDNIGLKWPNDLYCQGKKLAGILIEMTGETDGPCVAVIGLGLNVVMPAYEAEGITQAWTDLYQITGRKLDRNPLAASLLNEFLKILSVFEHVGIAAYLAEWRQYDCLINQTAKLFIADQPITGIVRGIDDKGFLLLEHPDGRIQAFASGDVSFSGQSA